MKKWLGNRGTLLPSALLLGVIAVASATAVATTRQIPAAGTTSIVRSDHPGIDQIQDPEFARGVEQSEGAGSFNRPRPGFKNGKFPKRPLDAPVVPSSAVAGSNPELALSF